MDGDSLVIVHEGAVAKLAGLPSGTPRRVPLASISDVALHGANVLSNGWLAIGLNGELAPDLRMSTAASCRDAIMFRRKDQATFEALHQWLVEVIAHHRRQPTREISPSVSSPAVRIVESPTVGPGTFTDRAFDPTAAEPVRRESPTPGRYQTARPTGRPVDPSAVQSEYLGVAGESFYDGAFVAIFKRRGLSITDGAEISDATAHLAVDPRNPYDENAVAVWVEQQHVGFLPRAAAAVYSPALAELADEDRHLTVPARVWAASSWDEQSIRSSVSLSMPPPSGVQAFNAFPRSPIWSYPRARAPSR